MMEIKRPPSLMRVMEKMINPISIEKRSTSLYPMDLITLAQKELSEIRTVLPSYTCN